MPPAGFVFDIQRFCIHDGPGIRTIVFLKGCPLRCQWCQNPEGIDPRPEIGFSHDRCIGCGECQKACPIGAIIPVGTRRIDRNLCDRCGKCVDACYAGALQAIGKRYTPRELLDEVAKDMAFFRTSGGGITLSGGEPTGQVEFLTAFLPLARAKALHITMETCGHVACEKLEAIVPLLDLVLYDVKAIDPVLHKRLTGRDNKTILQNLGRLVAAGTQVRVRIPLIPTLTATRKNLQDISVFLKDHGIATAELLPYHKMGEAKLQKIDSPLKPLNLPKLDDTKLAAIATFFRDAGVEVIY